MSQTVLCPYLHFNGEAQDALNFYQSVFGGETQVVRFGDFPAMPVAEEMKNDIMHSQLKASGMTLMLSDATPLGELQAGKNFSVSVSGEDTETLTKYFEGLSAGGTITEPLRMQQWGANFGMLVDKFGISWMVNITPAA
ncbi:MAG: 3-demethylubiquinone-9 3-methyltransferase [Candidatus Saccharibacteria bacterium]|nr:3-demethylubiquinone-9 3-methyltransferase [Candidatus Saccharibacteria bacterium]